jgi:hypothetical protein
MGGILEDLNISRYNKKVTEAIGYSNLPGDAKPIKLTNSVRSKINKEIGDLVNGQYFDKIPLDSLFKILEKYGVKVTQEDGTAWEGFITGNEGHTNFDLADLDTVNDDGVYGVPVESWLVFSWYRMQSGRYEVMAYVS